MTLVDGAPAEQAPVSPMAADPNRCTRQPWCIKPTGHKGPCAKRRPGEKRSHGTRQPAASSPLKATPAKAPAKNPNKGMRPLLASLWLGIGQLVEMNAPEPAGPPVGRMLQFEAPYAAEQLHPHLRRLPLYRGLDEVTGGIMDDIGPLIMAPVIVGLMATNPALGRSLEPMLRGTLEQMAVAMVTERRKVAQALRERTDLDDEIKALLVELSEGLWGPPPARGEGGWDGGNPPAQP